MIDRATERSLAQRFWDALTDLDTVISRDVTRVGDRCPISSVEPYTPAMEAADKAAAGAKTR